MGNFGKGLIERPSHLADQFERFQAIVASLPGQGLLRPRDVDKPLPLAEKVVPDDVNEPPPVCMPPLSILTVVV